VKAKYLTLSILMAVCLCGCQKSTEMEVPQLLEPVEVQVDTATAEKGDMFRTELFKGEVVPYVENVFFNTEGTLGELLVTIGEEVTAGQKLAVLDTEQIEMQIKDRREKIENTKTLGEFSDRNALADIEIAQEELKIMERGTATDQACQAKQVAIERQKNELKQTQQMRELEVEKMQVQLEGYISKLSETAIYAPFDGTVVYINQMKPGDHIQSYVPVICIADNSQMRIQSEYIPISTISGAERIYAKINGNDYDVTYVEADSGENIYKVFEGIELNTDFSIDKVDEHIESGQFAAVMIMYSCEENVLTIPVNALYRDAAGQYVYKILDGERVRCDVSIGMKNDVKVQILEGLEEGDVVYVKE